MFFEFARGLGAPDLTLILSAARKVYIRVGVRGGVARRVARVQHLVRGRHCALRGRAADECSMRPSRLAGESVRILWGEIRGCCVWCRGRRGVAQLTLALPPRRRGAAAHKLQIPRRGPQRAVRYAERGICPLADARGEERERDAAARGLGQPRSRCSMHYSAT